MSAGNLITFYIGILLMLSIKQIFTTECDINKGDCVADDKRGKRYCKSACFRTPGGCQGFKGVDLFGKDQKYQCHCKHLSDCQFQILSKCENGCLPGYEEPYCQKRNYHEFIKNESKYYSHLFSSDNQVAVKPQIFIQFRNTYRFNTVEIHSNYTDAAMRVTYPTGMVCKLKRKTNKTICTGDVMARVLNIKGNAGVYRIKLHGCPPELYGENCINKCHCARGESCHQISGICKNGCEDGWHGEKCDKQTYDNIAQGKQTSQSSIYGESNQVFVFHNRSCSKIDITMTSDKAVDGNFDHVFLHKSCSHTEIEKDPYWQVTFDKPYMISQLRIYNRMTHRDRLSGFKVYLGTTLCFESRNNEHLENVIYIKCDEPVNSTNVKISLEGNDKILTLCEVEVLQCLPGFYGYMCMERCEFCEVSKCDQITGCNQGCITGYYWNKSFKQCKECEEGKFGVSCEGMCHCVDNRTCNVQDGTCPDGCAAGYQGDDCQQECEEGKFGVSCEGMCHCVDNRNCNIQDGTCPDGCTAGYQGDDCQQVRRKGQLENVVREIIKYREISIQRALFKKQEPNAYIWDVAEYYDGE